MESFFHTTTQQVKNICTVLNRILRKYSMLACSKKSEVSNTLQQYQLGSPRRLNMLALNYTSARKLSSSIELPDQLQEQRGCRSELVSRCSPFVLSKTVVNSALARSTKAAARRDCERIPDLNPLYIMLMLQCYLDSTRNLC